MDAAIPVERILSTPAKVLCSAIWVSGREPDEAMPNSVFFATRPELRELMDVTIDRGERSVTISMQLNDETVPQLIDGYRKMYPSFEADWTVEAARLKAQGEVSRTARYFDDQGSIIMPLDGSGLSFEPVSVESSLPPASGVEWPMGDVPRAPSNGVDRGRMQAAAELAFADPNACTAAFIAVHRGQIDSQPRLTTRQSTACETRRLGQSRPAQGVGGLQSEYEWAA